MANKQRFPGQAFASETVDIILNQILVTRLQRKAKSVITTSLQFLVTDLVILLTAIDYEVEDEAMKVGIYVMIGIGAFYALALSMFLFIHAACFTSKEGLTTAKEVEDSYTKTNGFPVIDGLLELHFPAKFRGSTWYLPYIMWSFFAAIVAATSVLFAIERDQVTNSTLAALVTACLLLYQVTSDFSEYWVLSRNQVNEGGEEEKEVLAVADVGRRNRRAEA